jgi:threonine/homoserine/homoserine lactone efflux protein
VRPDPLTLGLARETSVTRAGGRRYCGDVIDIDRVAAFAVAAFIIIVVPGPSVMFVVSRGVALGRKAALATVVGNSLGAFSQGVLVVFGLGAIVTRSVAVYNVVKFVGALYLIWLGFRAFRHRRELSTELDAAAEPKSARRIVREGFVVGVTNPKVVVFFSAVLPQFVDRSRGAVTVQMLILLAVFAAITIVSDGTWGLIAGSVRSWFRRSPKRLEQMVGLGGLSIMGLGVRLAISRRHD